MAHVCTSPKHSMTVFYCESSDTRIIGYFLSNTLVAALKVDFNQERLEHVWLTWNSIPKGVNPFSCDLAKNVRPLDKRFINIEGHATEHSSTLQFCSLKMLRFIFLSRLTTTRSARNQLRVSLSFSCFGPPIGSYWNQLLSPCASHSIELSTYLSSHLLYLVRSFQFLILFTSLFISIPLCASANDWYPLFLTDATVELALQLHARWGN